MLLIRDAEADDLGELRRVFRRSALSNDGDRETMLAHPDVLEFEFPGPGPGGPGPGTRAGARVGARVRVAVVDGRIAGFATSRLVATDRLELEDLFVDPGAMRGGIGAALVEDVDAWAKDNRCGSIEVTANPHALAFYERVGFISEGTAETRFGPAPRMRRPVERSL